MFLVIVAKCRCRELRRSPPNECVKERYRPTLLWKAKAWLITWQRWEIGSNLELFTNTKSYIYGFRLVLKLMTLNDLGINISIHRSYDQSCRWRPRLLCGGLEDLEQPAVWSHVDIIIVHVQAPPQDATFTIPTASTAHDKPFSSCAANSVFSFWRYVSL